MIFGITGFAQSGKNTAAAHLVNQYGFIELAFAKALKDFLYEMNPPIFTEDGIRAQDVFSSAKREKPLHPVIKETARKYYEIAHRYGFKIYPFQAFASVEKLNPYLNSGGAISLQKLVDEEGWDKVKVWFPEVRRLLQVLGTECGREIFGQDCWVNIAFREMREDKNYVFTDLRFPNERDAVKKAKGVTLRIQREGVKAANAHSSEQVLDGIDCEVVNNGTIEELHNNLDKMFEEILRHGSLILMEKDKCFTY